MVTETNKHNFSALTWIVVCQVWFQNRRAKFRKTERLNQQKGGGEGGPGNNNNNSGGRATPGNTAASIKSELGGGKQSPGDQLGGAEHKAEMKPGGSPSSPTSPHQEEQHLSPPARSPLQTNGDRGKWSPLSTVNTSQLSSLPALPALPAQSPLPSPSKHFSPPPSTMSSYYPAPPSHAPYHMAAAGTNTFSSPLSALLGSSSHYLFNSEAKGPTVQIF